MHKPFIIIISSPSGAGKTTISKYLIRTDKNIKMSVSSTTRSKREGETEGQDYFFTDREQFEKDVQNGKFVEHAKIFNEYYGTPANFIDQCLNEKKDVLFDIDWQGTIQVKEKFLDNIITIFILPPSFQELERRLKTRATDSESKIKERLSWAKEEITKYHLYDYVIINDDIEKAKDEVESIIKAERIKRTSHDDFIKNLG